LWTAPPPAFQEDTKNDNQDVSNSKFLKDQKIDKVLLAKKFLDIVKKDKSKVKLSQTTTDNFKTIFEKIGECFNHAD